MINMVEIKKAIAPPAFIRLEEKSEHPKDKRVSKPDKWIHENIMHLFLNERSHWKLDEVEKRLNHPRAGL